MLLGVAVVVKQHAFVFPLAAGLIVSLTFAWFLGLSERKRLAGAASALFDLLGCAGVARFDFFLTEEGPVLNEVNTMPGFTEQSQVPKMFAAAGMSYADLLDRLVRDVLPA